MKMHEFHQLASKQWPHQVKLYILPGSCSDTPPPPDIQIKYRNDFCCCREKDVRIIQEASLSCRIITHVKQLYYSSNMCTYVKPPCTGFSKQPEPADVFLVFKGFSWRLSCADSAGSEVMRYLAFNQKLTAWQRRWNSELHPEELKSTEWKGRTVKGLCVWSEPDISLGREALSLLEK